MRHKKHLSLVLIVLGLAFAVFSFNLPTAHGQEEFTGDPERGGKLYANWDLLIGFSDFESQHPIWVGVGSSQVSERITYRCVSCHGWDYRGSEGRLTYPGLQQGMDSPSLLTLMGNPPEEILPWLDGTNNPEHDFSAYLTQQDLHDLSLFISRALVAPNLIASREDNSVQGTVTVGKNIYHDFCQSCHGTEGEKINFGSTATPTFLGDMAWSNPWRVAHVVRFGHIIGNMPPASTLEISFSRQIDLLTYLQTLPRARTIASAETQNIDFSSQASTLPLVYGAIGISILIFATVYITLKQRS